jgi:hypothetical protein
MEKLSVPVKDVIRENAALLLTYSLSLEPIQTLVTKSLQGSFERFRQTAIAMTRQRAERACIELAVLVRYLLDENQVGLGTEQVDFGDVSYGDGKSERLILREVTNKIIHARAFDWDTSRFHNHPELICFPRDKQRWKEARIDVVALSIVCGSIEGS